MFFKNFKFGTEHLSKNFQKSLRFFISNHLSLTSYLPINPNNSNLFRYHSDNWSHSNFNSKEIGSKLAESVLGLFDPTLEGIGDASSNVNSSTTTPSSLGEEDEKEKLLIPRYKDAVVELCKLPGMIIFTLLLISTDS